MLNFLTDGSITLTIKGYVIVSIDPMAASQMTAIDLVLFENKARLNHYEINNGFYSLKNQVASRNVKILNHEKYGHPLESEDSFNSYWEKKRRESIDS